MRKSRRGANAIEFALILPILLAFGYGLMDLGWNYLVRHAASSAAAAGARAGALAAQDGDPSSRALAAAGARWSELGLPVQPTVQAAQEGVPSMMVVTVQVDLEALIGFDVGPETVEVTAAQRMEDQP